MLQPSAYSSSFDLYLTSGTHYCQIGRSAIAIPQQAVPELAISTPNQVLSESTRCDHSALDTPLCPVKHRDPLFKALSADEWTENISISREGECRRKARDMAGGTMSHSTETWRSLRRIQLVAFRGQVGLVVTQISASQLPPCWHAISGLSLGLGCCSLEGLYHYWGRLAETRLVCKHNFSTSTGIYQAVRLSL